MSTLTSDQIYPIICACPAPEAVMHSVGSRTFGLTGVDDDLEESIICAHCGAVVVIKQPEMADDVWMPV